MLYISIERLISIKFPSHRFVLRENDNQLTFFILLTGTILLVYIPIPMFNDILHETSNLTNKTKSVCDFISAKSRLVLNYFDIVLRIIIPALIMLLCSCSLVFNFIKLRGRIRQNFLNVQSSRFKRYVLFAVKTMFLNLIFIILNLPFSLILFLPKFFDFN